MDGFKQTEISRMQNGGNKAWQDFYNQNSGTTFEESTIRERYDSEVGEEWKERLTAKVEGTEFDKAAFTKERAAILQKQASRSATPVGARKPMGGIGSTPDSRSDSPVGVKAGLPPAQKAKNEAYFAKMGQANASRPEDLPPNQGGKFAGFGSAPPEPQRPQGGLPSADEFQQDPVGALTKGFGWFSSVVGKQAKAVNDSYIQPTAKNVCSTQTTHTDSLRASTLISFLDRIVRFRSTSPYSSRSSRANNPIRRQRRSGESQQIYRGPGRTSRWKEQSCS